MAKEKVAGLMSTEIGLNTAKATQGLNELKSAVKDSTNEWKQMESQMKASGDEIGASEAKYKGLSQSVEKQQDVLQKLRQEQAEVNRSTEAGEKTYQKYASQITTAERQLNSMIAQQAKAKQAYELQESGIAGLNKEIQQSIKETDAYVERLKAEGKEEEALKAQKEGLSRTLDKQSQLYEAQSRQLEKMTKSGDASSESISKQKIALDKTATSIAKGKQSLEELDLGQSKIGKNEGATEAGGKFEKLTGAVGKTTAGLTATVAVAGTALAGVSKLVGAIYDQQGQVSALQAKTTGSYKESKEAISAINKLYAQGYGESVEDLTETYTKLKQMNPKAEVGELAEQTKLVTQYSKASGADTEEVLKGAQNATKAWNMSYQEYFDNLFTLQKQGGDVGGEISDNMAEYSQVLGQMGLSAKDSFSMIANGIKTGAYNGDKLLDFTKEFSISLNDGRMDKAIGDFSKKSQDMFQGYKDGKVTAGDMFKQITGEMGKMTDKQKEATLASNLWSALGEDNSLKVLGSLGKQNKAFSDVSGTAKKASDQLKESNPFELMKRSAEASVSSVTMSATETKKFKKALEPLQKAVKNFINTMVKNMPAIVKAITPVVNFVAKHGKAITAVLTGILALHFGSKVVSSVSGVIKSVKTLLPVLKSIGTFMAANPATIWIAGFVALAIALTELYKHSAKFRSFVNGLVEVAGNFFKSVGKWIGSATKTVGKFFSNIGKWFSGVGKSISDGASAIGKWFSGLVRGFQKGWDAFIKFATGLLKTFGKIVLISMALPLGIAITLMKPLVGPMKTIISALAKWLKSVWTPVKNTWTSTWNAIGKWFSSLLNSIIKMWNTAMTALGNTLRKEMDAISSVWSKAWSAISRIFTDVWNKMVRVFEPIIKSIQRIVSDTVNAISSAWSKAWSSIADFFSNIWSKLVHIGENGINAIKNVLSPILSAIGRLFSDTWKGIKNGFSSLWDDMMAGAKAGINGVIGVINTGIGGINTVIHMFGGKENALGKIPKFANGTKGAPKGLAIVNDAPGEHYQEAIIDNSGRATVLEGRNRLVNFSGGETVIPAHALPKFAHGTDNWLDTAIGWIKDKWDKLTEFIAHPIKALGNVMNKAVSGIAGSPLVTNIAPAMANGLVQGIADPIVNMFKSLKKKHDDEGSAAPAGSGVQRWKDLVIKALDKNGLSTSESMVNKVLRQIQSESGGNEKAVQGGYTDINTITGDLAKGLMQTISATFNAYKFPGHGNIFNGYDNLLAALNYAKHRYGSNLSFLGQGHGYENGGIVSTHGLYEVAERNMPEIIIPLDPAKKMRANDLLEQANARINGNQVTETASQTDLSRVESKLDNMISLLSQLANGQGNQVVQAIFDRNDLYRKQANDVNFRGYQSLI